MTEMVWVDLTPEELAKAVQLNVKPAQTTVAPKAAVKSSAPTSTAQKSMMSYFGKKA